MKKLSRAFAIAMALGNLVSLGLVQMAYADPCNIHNFHQMACVNDREHHCRYIRRGCNAVNLGNSMAGICPFFNKEENCNMNQACFWAWSEGECSSY